MRFLCFIVGRYEPKLIQEIVEAISKEKLSKIKIDIAKYPVGIQSHVQKINKRFAINSKEERFAINSKEVLKVGIYGCQGVGKNHSESYI